MNKKDKKSKNLIKKFLVASAAVSGLVGVSGSVGATVFTTANNDTHTATNAEWNPATGVVAAPGNTIKFGGDHQLTINNDLTANSGTFTIDYDNKAVGGNNRTILLDNTGKIKVTNVINTNGNGATFKFNHTTGMLELDGNFSAANTINEIDFNNIAGTAILNDNTKLNLLNIQSAAGAGNGIVDAKANFEITTKAFGDGAAIGEFKLFTATANSTGKITFDTKAAAMNAANKIKFYNNGKLELSSTAPNNSVTFTADLDIDDKTATITFSGGGDGNGFNIYDGVAAADRIKGAKNTSFVIDMADPNALVDLSKVTNASFLKGVAADTAQKLTIKKGRTLVSKDAKFATITFEGSEKGNGTLALAGAADEIHTIKLAEASPENTGVLEITAQNQSLDANSTIFTENSPGVRELYFSDDKTLTLTKESKNIDALYITSKVGQDNTGTLALVGSATLGSTTTDSYIGWYPSAAQVDNGAIKADEERVKAITLTTNEDKQEMVFNQKKIRLGKFDDALAGGGANSGIIANHTGKSSNWTFSGNDIRSHFTVADANTKAKVIFNNQDDAGITLAGTWGSNVAKLEELKIATKSHVKLDNSNEQTPGYNGNNVALGGFGKTSINTKLLKFETDVNIIASDTLLSLANVDAISAEGKGGIIIASSSAVYDPTNTIGDGFSYGTGVSKDHVKKLVDGKVARFGITGEADVTIATDADKTKVMGIKIADLVDLDASNLKIVTLKHNKGAVVIEGQAKIGDIGSTEFNFAEARFLGTKEATYTNNVFAKNVAIKAASGLVFNGNIYNQDAIEITGDKTVAFGGNVGNIKSSAAELTFNGKDKTIGNLGAASTAAAPTNYIQQKVNFINGSASVGSVYAKDLNVKDYEFKISEAKVMHANNSSTQENATYTFNDATSSLELTTPTGQHVYSKTLTLNLKRSNDTSQSKIIFNDLSKIDLDNVSAIAINLEASYDSDVTPDVATSKALVFIGTPDNADTSKLKTKLDQVSKLYPKNPNRFQSYSRNGLFIVSKVVSIKDAADNIYNDLIADTKVSNEDAKMVRAYIESFSDASPNSAFSRFLQKIETNQDKAKANQNIVTFVKNTQEVVRDTYNVISSTTSVASRIADGLGNRMAAVAVSSSGDENPVSSVGAYLQPFMSFADNSEEGNKYSLSGGGFTIGGDVGLNDNNTVLGLAYTFASNKLKFKNSTSDTTNASTNAFSVYATQKIASGAFVEGLFTYASTDARANLNRVSGIDAKGELTYKTIKNDYNVKTMIGRALLGYSYQMDSFVISPLVGAEFVSTNIKDGVLFKEKDIPAGTSIKAKNTVNPAVLLGARFATEIDSDDMKIIPTAGLLMKFKLSDKDMEVSQALDGFKGAYVYKKNKLSKFSVVPSVGVTVKQNQMEYSATYAADISSKYLGHNAGLKVKINF